MLINLKNNPNDQNSDLIDILEGLSSKNWKEDEKKRLTEGIHLFGNDWNKVADFVGTRGKIQVMKQAEKIKRYLK